MTTIQHHFDGARVCRDHTSLGFMIDSLEALVAKIRHEHSEAGFAIDDVSTFLDDLTPKMEEKMKGTHKGIEEDQIAVKDMLVAGLGPKGRTDHYPPKVDTDGYPLTYQIGTGPEVDSEGREWSAGVDSEGRELWRFTTNEET